MKRAGKTLLFDLSLSSKLVASSAKPQTPLRPLSLLRPLSTTSNTKENNSESSNPKTKRDSIILEKFKQKQLKGSQKIRQTTTLPSSSIEKTSQNEGVMQENNRRAQAEVLSNFEGLGLREEVIGALEVMGICVPSEIQCVGIPAVLEGKSVVLSSDSGSGRTLAYLLPLVQLLRQDEALFGLRPKHPRAVVLSPTEEQSDEVFRMAKFISDCAQMKTVEGSGSGQLKSQEVLSNTSIGMLVGTPSEIIQYMDEGSVVLDDIKYLVLDEADAMLDSGLGPEIQNIISPLKNMTSRTNKQGFQTVLVISTIKKLLGKKASPLMERLERDNARKVTAMFLEMDQTEVSDLIKSPNVLKQKVAEAINSIHTNASES